MADQTDERRLKRFVQRFSSGDLYCSLWPILGLAGFDEESWPPQFNDWQRPAKLDDGGNGAL